MSQASEVELLMLSLINQERTSRGLDPLTINNDLNASSEDHSQWMLENDIFSHTGVNGTSSRDRIEAADYELEGSWRTAENIGWQSERGDPGIDDDVADIHDSLMNSPGHRANILNPDLEDIGIGIELGDFNGYDAVMITQNFGRTDAVSVDPDEDNTPVVLSDDDTLVVPPTEAAPAPVDEEGPVDVAGQTPTLPVEPEPTPAPETADDTPTQEDTPPTTEAFDFAAFFDRFFAGFDFAAMDRVDEGADDVMVVTAFEGTIATPEDTVTTDDPAEFEAMFAGTQTCDIFDFA